jgi:hypothetical protein
MLPGSLVRSRNSLECSRILILSAANRRRDAVVAILRTLPGCIDILFTDQYDHAFDLLATLPVAFVILDYTFKIPPHKQIINEIRQAGGKTTIIQVVAHPREIFTNQEPRPNHILCDGFTCNELLDTVQKGI